MPLILPVKDKSPVWGSDCYIAENSTIVGDVIMGDNCSVWFNAVIRGDVNYIKIGNNVSIGHNALVHGCILHDNVLIGMGAIVMDYAVVEPFVIIAAGAIVLEKTICESGYLYAGIPAKKIKPITDEQREMLKRLPNNYIMYSSWFKE